MNPIQVTQSCVFYAQGYTTFKVASPKETPASISGSIPELGSWELDKALPLEWNEDEKVWQGSVHLPRAHFYQPINYKCVLKQGENLNLEDHQRVVKYSDQDISFQQFEYQEYLHGLNHEFGNNYGEEQLRDNWEYYLKPKYQNYNPEQ